ncbi:MAG: WecB/TagA/CpsF family glycosyltransferase [Cocleimonas sp.]
MEENINVMGYPIFIGNISSLPLDNKSKTIIATINPHSYVTAKTDPDFKKALLTSNFLVPDGSGIVLAAKQAYKTNIKKVSGADLHQYLLEDLNEKGGKCFYMGASKKTLRIIHEKISVDFPNIEVETYSPPFKDNFTDEENRKIISQVNLFEPDILFIGMTAPKQEKWLIKHKDDLTFKVAVPIGAVFDFYAGTIARPSTFWISLHLEWFARLMKEPKRLWKRNFVSTPLFLIDMMLFKIGLKK